MSTVSQDAIVSRYLDQLRAALGDAPAARRNQLVEEISEHIAEARADLPVDDDVALNELLDRVGRPEDIAMEAGFAPSARRRPWVVAALVAVLLLLAGTTVGMLATHHHRESASAMVRVPSIVGRPTMVAVSTIRAAGLAVSVTTSKGAGSSTIVLAQQPAGGTQIRRSQAVRLLVGPASSTVTTTTVPPPSPATTTTQVSAAPAGTTTTTVACPTSMPSLTEQDLTSWKNPSGQTIAVPVVAIKNTSTAAITITAITVVSDIGGPTLGDAEPGFSTLPITMAPGQSASFMASNGAPFPTNVVPQLWSSYEAWTWASPALASCPTHEMQFHP